MNRFLLLIIACVFANTLFAQEKIQGVILDINSNEPIVGASILLRNSDKKIISYTTSDYEGSFHFENKNDKTGLLEISMIGFSKRTISLDSITFPLTIMIEPCSTLLKEVTVKADRIREQGDTITYNVGSFTKAQDRSIGDVLKRMPGINVENSGKIQYQGKDINKFYIEGSDLLGGKYGIATNGISHEDVGAIEIMENHQPMQVLSGISFSDKAAINLKLKNKAKATWSFHGDAGGGYSWQPEGAIWDGELFAMAVMPCFQNITTFKTNNIGEDLSAQATDFFASQRGTGLRRYVGISLPDVPNLSRKRTLFNCSALISTNSLWKFGKGEFKALIDYSFNRVTAAAANITTYFLNDDNHVVTENRNGVDRTHSLSGKLIYELNQKTAFINNTLKTKIDWDDVRLNITGSLPNDQTASLPDYYISNDFKLIKRFNGKHLITFKIVNEWESLPQTLSLYNEYEESVSNRLILGDENRCSIQQVKDQALYTNESAAYAFSVNGITISLEGGIKGYFRTLNTELPDMPEEIPGETTNMLSTNYFTVYATTKFEYWVQRVNFSLNSPVNFAQYTFDKTLANRSEVYFSPSLSMNWKPNNRLSIGVRGSSGRSPMDLNLIHPGYIMTDYRSFRSGVDDFYSSTSQNVSANLSYKHPRLGLFANAFAMQSWSHNPYTLAQQLYGDYIVYSYTPAKSNGRMLMASGNIGKTLDFMRGSANINGSFSSRETHLISEHSSVNSVGTMWSAGLKINGTPLRWLSFDYRFSFSSSLLTMNGTNASSWLGNMENELMLNIMPHKKWEWHISGEHYRNELTEDNFKNVFLLDTKLIYKLNKKLELSASLSNIFNQHTYHYRTFNQLTSVESLRQLRSRQIFFSITLKK